MHVLRSILAAALGTTVAACYSAEVDPNLEATYACDQDSDCALGQSCLLNLCTDGSTMLGPAPEILGPELLQVFPSGTPVMMPIVVGGDGLALTEPGGDNVLGEGSIEVRIDGEKLQVLTAGDLAGRVQTDPVTLPDTPGLHRIEAIARQNDGSIYANAEARGMSAFWVDDGTEHVAFLQPRPETEIPIGEGGNLVVEVVALNFALTNPGLVPTADLRKPGQGHVHLFFDRQIPDCLPDCNFNYESTGFPSQNPVSRLTIPGGVRGSKTPGTYPLSIVAQNSAHEPYYQNADPTVLVYDRINVLMVEQ